MYRKQNMIFQIRGIIYMKESINKVLEKPNPMALKRVHHLSD